MRRSCTRPRPWEWCHNSHGRTVWSTSILRMGGRRSARCYLFAQSLDKFMNPHNEQVPWLLLWDLASVHTSADVRGELKSQFAWAKFTYVPGNATAYCQPLDKVIFRPFKAALFRAATMALAKQVHGKVRHNRENPEFRSKILAKPVKFMSLFINLGKPIKSVLLFTKILGIPVKLMSSFKKILGKPIQMRAFVRKNPRKTTDTHAFVQKNLGKPMKSARSSQKILGKPPKFMFL